ncbi:MAG: hypothetical protein FWB95_05680 [Treponema sp.]|nr:hypothetical protein [Treponema sp.]
MPIILTILLVISNISVVFGFDLPVSRISDDSLLRNRMKDAWITEAPGRVLSQRARTEVLENGERVLVSAVEGREEFMVLFSRELIRGTSVDNRRGTREFPGWAQGSWMITRRKDTGAGTLIRFFPRSDQNTHIQFKPFDREKSQMDVVIYGAYISRSIPVAVPFERIYTMQLNDILSLVESKHPLHYFEVQPYNYTDSRKMIEQIRSRMGALRFADDGAIDENGNYVFIETLQAQSPNRPGLNCSGFSKWLIDGLLRPVTGNRLAIEPLKAPFGVRGSSFTVNWEERRDVFFGLDWIRNLAAEANGTLRSASYRDLAEFEIRVNNFSSLIVNENRTFVANSYPGFLPEAGYGIQGLHPLLYTLAIDEPYSFYLAAVSTEISTPSSVRGTPRLRQYYHIAALIPYFDEYGNFRIVVFESAAETSFNAFRNRYPGHHVNLVKIPVSDRFDP